MPTLTDENTPLLSAQRSPNFFQKSISAIRSISLKTIGIVSTSAVSVVTYFNPAYNAGASVADGLKEIAAGSGLGTNFLFNIQAYRELLQQFPSLLKMPWKLSAALFFATMCVAPNLFMNIVDEEGNYIDEPNMILQIISAFLNIGVNVVGSMELINNISSVLKNKTDLHKEKLIEEINSIIEEFAKKQRLETNEPLNPEAQAAKLIPLLTANNDLSLREKISYYSLNSSLGLFAVPQFSAYLLISYFGMRDLADKKLEASTSISMLLGLIAAIGNAIPGAGFSIKGVTSTSKKLMSLEKPSLLAMLFVLPALFSGFTTHKAMADSLKELGYSGNIAEALKWIANLGAALIYNLPQMLILANSINAPEINTQLSDLKKHLEVQVKNLDASEVQDFKNGLPIKISSFFNTNPVANENNDTHSYSDLHSINTIV